MLNIKEIKELITIVEKSELTVFELTQGDVRLVLKKGGALPAAAAPVRTEAAVVMPAALPAASAPVLPADDGAAVVTSPVIGTFYRAAEPGAEPYVGKGSVVKPGDVLGIVEVMKLFNEVKAESAGTIEDILAEDGQMVEYGQPLFRIQKA
jgi:acetyl-CoA carboxylase biotin carboxyl carrier protein